MDVPAYKYIVDADGDRLATMTYKKFNGNEVAGNFTEIEVQARAQHIVDCLNVASNC